MKKYPFFFFAAMIILIASICTPEVMYASLPKVEYIKAEKQSTEKTVTVSGKIKSEQENTQTADCAYIVSEVLVNAGDNIEKGDRILKVDTENTEKIYLQNGATYNGGLYITSDYSGTVNTVYVAKGATTTENTQLISIIDTDNLCAVLMIGEDVFSQIKIGQTLTITGSAFEGSYDGKITQIGAVATQSATSAVYVEAITEIESPDSKLKPGFNIKARIVINTKENALIIPSNCVSQDDNGEFVYKLNSNKVEKVYIKTGDITSKGTEIKSGIKDGEYIIANPESIEKDNSYVSFEE